MLLFSLLWGNSESAKENPKLLFTAVVQHELDAFMKYADVNGDGKIQYKEWYVVYTTVYDVCAYVHIRLHGYVYIMLVYVNGKLD